MMQMKLVSEDYQHLKCKKLQTQLNSEDNFLTRLSFESSGMKNGHFNN